MLELNGDGRVSQIFYITPEAAAGFQQSCIVSMAYNALSLAQADVIAALSPDACGGIQAPLLSHANPDALAGLQSDCASQLYSACSGFTRLSLREVPPTTFHAFSCESPRHVRLVGHPIASGPQLLTPTLLPSHPQHLAWSTWTWRACGTT